MKGDGRRPSKSTSPCTDCQTLHDDLRRSFHTVHKIRQDCQKSTIPQHPCYHFPFSNIRSIIEHLIRPIIVESVLCKILANNAFISRAGSMGRYAWLAQYCKRMRCESLPECDN